MIEFTVGRVGVPTRLDEPEGADFIAAYEARNATAERAYGTPDVRHTADEVLPYWLDPEEPHALWVARIGDRVVARGTHHYMLDSPEVGWVDLDVHPDAERLGIGRALAEAIETHARELGQSRLITYVVSPDGPGPRIDAPTGFGSVPAENREVRFLVARGFRLEQVERGSRLPLPADEGVLAERAAEASAHAGPDYRVHTWVGRTPPRWLADIAILRTRMSTDAPSAGLDEPEEPWDADRVVAAEQREADGPRVAVTAVVEHVPSGTLAAYTQLHVSDDVTRPVSQYDTLVLREHRGHRLGMMLKVANLRHLTEVAPGHPSVLTWNAEENRPMLDVNEAVGFVPIGYEGAWRLDLS